MLVGCILGFDNRNRRLPFCIHDCWIGDGCDSEGLAFQEFAPKKKG
jgi:hypothetical protein